MVAIVTIDDDYSKYSNQIRTDINAGVPARPKIVPDADNPAPRRVVLKKILYLCPRNENPPIANREL